MTLNKCLKFFVAGALGGLSGLIGMPIWTALLIGILVGILWPES